MGGYLAVLKWARNDGFEWSKRLPVKAASAYHLEILEWMSDQGDRFNLSNCRIAIQEGNHRLRMFGESPAQDPWNEPTCNYRAKENYQESLAWLAQATNDYWGI